jgi:hypothetical protein
MTKYVNDLFEDCKKQKLIEYLSLLARQREFGIEKT